MSDGILSPPPIVGAVALLACPILSSSIVPATGSSNSIFPSGACLPAPSHVLTPPGGAPSSVQGGGIQTTYGNVNVMNHPLTLSEQQHVRRNGAKYIRKGQTASGTGTNTLAEPIIKRIRVDRTQQCPFTVRVRWGSRLDIHAAAQAQALEVLSGLTRPDMGLAAWSDTQVGDLVGRIVAKTNSVGEVKERSGIAGFLGTPFTIVVYFANMSSEGSVQLRVAHRARFDEHGVLIRNPYYFQLLGEIGYAGGSLLLIEATTSHAEKTANTVMGTAAPLLKTPHSKFPPPPQYNNSNTAARTHAPSILVTGPKESHSGGSLLGGSHLPVGQYPLSELATLAPPPNVNNTILPLPILGFATDTTAPLLPTPPILSAGILQP